MQLCITRNIQFNVHIYIRVLGYLNTRVSIYQMAILMDWRINLEKH